MVGRQAGERVVALFVVLVLAAAVAIGIVLWSGSNPPQRAESGVLGPLAFAALVAAPAVLAILGWRERPWLLVAAGLALVPMSMLSLAGVLLPLLIPAGSFFGIAAARPRLPFHPRAQPAAAFLSTVFVVAAVATLFSSSAVRTVTTASSSYSSDVITVQGALTSLGFVVAALAIAALAPKDAPRPDVVRC